MCLVCDRGLSFDDELQIINYLYVTIYDNDVEQFLCVLNQWCILLRSAVYRI